MRVWHVLWIALAIFVSGGAAQEPTEDARVGIGISAGVLMRGDGLRRPEPIVWLQALQLPRRGIAFDIRAGVLPREFAKENDAVVSADLGIGYAFPWLSGHARLTAGAGAVVGVGGSATSFVDPGAFVGAGVLMPLWSPVRLRLTVREHVFWEEGTSLLRLTLGVGVVVPLPGA